MYLQTNSLNDIKNKITIFDIIGIDECQFFESEDLFTFCDTLANMGKNIIVSGLVNDFNKNPFISTLKLLSIADKISKLNSICKFCCKEASFTMKKFNKNTIIEVGGSELYNPVCRKCYNNII